MSLKEITSENTFSSKRNFLSITAYRNCLEKFAKYFDKEVALETNSPIFLDTNILLRYYSISFTARQKLFEFIKKYAKRIVLTSQVQFEFLRNREDIIQRFFEQVTNKIPKDFNSDIVNKLKNFVDQHKIVLKDYPFVETGIAKHQSELETLLQKLNDTVDEKRKEHVDLLIKDEFLDLLMTCNLHDNLTGKEIEVIKKDFDNLVKTIPTDNVDSFINKVNNVFPGLGDVKNKPDDPYGDYIIFHEIMKYMITNGVDAVFLTFDNTKGDWLNKNKSPHLHYVLNTYANTGHLLYIIDAERTLGELLNINIDSLVSDAVAETIPISIETLIALSESHKIFEGSPKVKFPLSLLEELNMHGYKSMNQITRALDKTAEAAIHYRTNENPRLTSLGMLKLGLRLSNPAYTTFVRSDGSIGNVQQRILEKYNVYRLLIT